MVNLTVDGKPVQIENGQTILQACRKLGLYVPTFCWDERLDSIGACRICLVEVDKMPKLQVACTIPAVEGMIVNTQSKLARDGRQAIMELMLANHPLDCPTCDKGGECDLQDVAFLSRKDSSPMSEPKRRFYTTPNSTFDERQIGPLIYLTMNRCIVCFKCVRFTSEIACEGDLGAFERGGHTNISTGIGEAVKNEFSGNIIEICPVGALTSKPFRYKIRTWLTEKKASVCNYCADGCNLTLWSAGGKIYRATSRRNDYVDQGWICDKGRFGTDVVNHKDRLTSPQVPKDGKKLDVTWDEAYQLAARELKRIKEKYGPDAIAALGSPHCSNEDNYILQKFFRAVIGTNHIDHRTYYKNPLPGEPAYGMSNSIPDLEKADVIAVLGCDLTAEHPILGLRVKKAVTRLGAKLLLVNNRGTKLSKFATFETILKPHTEVLLVNWLTKEVLDRQGTSPSNVDKAFMDWTRSFDAKNTETSSGVTENEVKQIAQSILNGKNVVFLLGRDVVTHPQAQDLISSVNSLAKVSGKMQGEHSGINLLWEYANSQGALHMGALPDRLPGLVPISDSASRTRLGSVWNATLPSKLGYNTRQILEAATRGEIKCLYIMQENPLEHFPDRHFVREALSKLEFLIVQAILPNDLSEMAHLVLPAASFGEKEGTYTNLEGRVQKSQPALKPAGNAKPDWQILCELGMWMQAPYNHYSLQEISSEIGTVIPGYSGKDYGHLSHEGSLVDGGKESLAEEYRPSPNKYEPVPKPAEYGFWLLTGNSVYHSGTLSSWSENLRMVADKAYCEIGVADAERLGLKDEDWVLVESPRGGLRLPAKIAENLQPGTLFMVLNFPESPVTFLMDKDSPADAVKVSKIKD